MRGLLPLILGLLLAGCLDSVPIGTDAPTPDPAPVLPVFQQTKIGIGADAESAVAVSPDGQVVLACAHGGFTQPSPLWASQDAGAAWRRIDPQPNPIVSGDCDLAITDNGDWYIIYDTIASATVAGSSDQGRTWRFHYFAAPPFGGVDRPWIQAVGNDLYLIYADIMSAQPFNAMFTKSTDGGRTWSPPQLMGVFPATDQTNCFLGHHIVKDGGRSIRAPINCWRGLGPSQGATFPNTVYFLTSLDGGRTWSTERVRGPDTTDHRIVIAAHAGPENTWLVYTLGSPYEVFVVLSRDDGKTWSQPLRIAHGTDMPLGWPWIDGRADGSATIAWMNTSRPANASGTGTHWQVHVARVTADPEPRLLFEGPVGEPGRGNALYEFLMVRHDAAGQAHIVYVMPGDGCQQAPPYASNMNRNRQCIHLLTEQSESAQESPTAVNSSGSSE